MRRIEATFNGLRERGEKALITFITAGDPDLETTAALVRAMAGAGADIIELGVPFSEPVADGPVIQQASQRALDGGVTLRGILETVRALREDVELPLVLMSYYNPIYQSGLDRFAREAAAAGADGLIVPDLPVEEAGPLLAAADREGLALIPLAAPTSTPARLRRIAASARGFLYCVAVTGVTGARQRPEEVRGLAARARQACSVPVVVGFGVATPAQAAEVGTLADGIVVGTAIVREVAGGGPDMTARVAGLTRELKAALPRDRIR
ncbi:MAG: tryptophan synthase subunit alpha [Thermoanaerobacterales bacterium]|nr:tryptophan synthase subunit alpha [Thermoanaerobacterales bacterium]